MLRTELKLQKPVSNWNVGFRSGHFPDFLLLLKTAFITAIQFFFLSSYLAEAFGTYMTIS